MTTGYFRAASIVLLLLTLITASSCATGAPPEPIYDKVIPGDASINAGRMQAHSIRYEKSSWSMDYVIEPAEKDGLSLWHAAIYFNREADTKPDSIWFDHTTLAFRSRLLPLQDYTIDVNMQNGLFSGILKPAEGSDYSPVDYHKTYPHDAFEPAIINYFIAALPLEIGYTASIPVFDLNNGSQMFWSNVQVVAEEVLNVDGHSFDTWKVVSDGIKKKTIWISKQFPFAIKMQTSGNSGSWMVVPDSIKLP